MPPVHDYVLDNATGANFRSDLNNALAAIVSNNSSSSEPSTKYAYQWWADTNEGVLKIRNSSNDGWVTLLQLDGTLTLEDGSASAPALGFRDDLNTGIFSSAADNVDITTGGTTRVNVSSTGINVTGTVTDDGATHDGDVTFTGASANIVFDKSDNQLEFADNAKAEFGTGGDLEIFHNGSNSKIDNSTGTLFIQGDAITLTGQGGSENMAEFAKNAAVKLYYDNVQTFETSANGIIVRGPEGGAGQVFINADEGDDFSDIFRLQTDTSGVFTIANGASGSYETNIECNGNGNVELYFDNSKKFETLTDGVKVSGQEFITEGTIILEKPTAHHHRILSNDTGNDLGFQQSSDTGANTNFTTYLRINDGGNISLPVDNQKLRLGASADLLLYHDGTDSYLENQTGNLFIMANNADKGIKVVPNGAVELYYDNSKKFETTSAGVTVTGTVTDSKGELRQIPQANHQGGTHTLQASDAGKHLLVDNAVTIPPTSGVFSTGDAITLISTSGSDISVNRGSGVTMYNAADGTNANRTLATRGIATVICTGSNTYNISGAGLS